MASCFLEGFFFLLLKIHKIIQFHNVYGLLISCIICIFFVKHMEWKSIEASSRIAFPPSLQFFFENQIFLLIYICVHKVIVTTVIIIFIISLYSYIHAALFSEKKLISFRNWFLVETFDNYYCVYCTWKEVVCMPLFVIILKQGFRVLWIATYCFSFYVFET